MSHSALAALEKTQFAVRKSSTTVHAHWQFETLLSTKVTDGAKTRSAVIFPTSVGFG